MALNGTQCIQAVLEHLRLEDVQMLLANRGLPSVGGKEELAESLQAALRSELCEWEWERCEVPGYHAEIVGAGATMATHNNCIYVFGGMDEERSETTHMWRWDLSTDDGFEPVHYRGHLPPKLMSGHFAAVHGDWLWVFPGPRNHSMRRVHCCDLLSLLLMLLLLVTGVLLLLLLLPPLPASHFASKRLVRMLLAAVQALPLLVSCL